MYSRSPRLMEIQSQAKLGLAVSIEAADEELMTQQDRMNDMPPPPF